MHVPCGSQMFHDSRLQRQPEGTDDERAGSRPRRDHTDQGLENHSIPLSALRPSGCGRTDEHHAVLDTSSHSRLHSHCQNGALGEPVPGHRGGSDIDQRTV
jgi:hypothetical protein